MGAEAQFEAADGWEYPQFAGLGVTDTDEESEEKEGNDGGVGCVYSRIWIWMVYSPGLERLVCNSGVMDSMEHRWYGGWGCV